MILKKLKELNNNIEKFYTKDLLETIKKLYEILKDTKYEVYFVGGVIRDIFMEISTKDIDVVSDDYLSVGNLILKNFEIEKYRINEKFLTYNIILKNGINIDIASFREEVYPFSGSLPIVKKSILEKDYKRRDFTINSIYYNIKKMEIFDPYLGKKDLVDKKIEILHKKSFENDPTRIIRGIKFASRYNFTFGKKTEIFLKESIEKEYLKNISFDRLKNELFILFKEKNTKVVIKFLKEYKILEFLKIKLDEEKIEKILEFYETNKNNKEMCTKFNIDSKEKSIFFGIFFCCEEDQRKELMKNFSISKKNIKKMEEFFLYILDIYTFKML